MNLQEIKKIEKMALNIAKQLEISIPKLENELKKMNQEDAEKYKDTLKDVNLNKHVADLNKELSILNKKIKSL